MAAEYTQKPERPDGSPLTGGPEQQLESEPADRTRDCDDRGVGEGDGGAGSGHDHDSDSPDSHAGFATDHGSVSSKEPVVPEKEPAAPAVDVDRESRVGSDQEPEEVLREKPAETQEDEAELETAPESRDKACAEHGSDTKDIEKEKLSQMLDEEACATQCASEELQAEGDADGEAGEEDLGGGEAGLAVKKRKTRLECRDCGKKFTRRETYNLHRHFHIHQDEQASLTCKECGVTFQHRSSLIKHRSEHKKVDMAPPSEKRPHNKEKSPQCENCGETFPTLVKLRNHCCHQAPEKLYRCPLCRKEFQYRVSINAHMQMHSLDSPFRCLECNKGFQCAMTLRIHQRSHAALKPYECPECHMVFRHRSVMEDHRRKHTEESPYECSICGKSFKYSSLLHQHQYLHTGQKPFRCLQCGKRFAFAQNMRAHCRQHKKHLHSCPHCPLTFTEETSLQAHVQTHDPSKRRMLNEEGKENANHAVELKRAFNCPLCPQIYDKVTDLRAHMLVHEAEFERLSNGKQLEEVHVCPRCPLRFSDEPSLRSHVATHEAASVEIKRDVRGLGVVKAENVAGVGLYGNQVDKKPLKCRECGRGFRHRSVLELHMRIHSKDKPYHCNVCGKSFRFSSYLQQHVIIHTGKKPYKCPDCGKDFAFLQNMKTHQRLHQQKPFRCTQCRKGYSEEAQLQRHMLSHTGDKPHKCHLCSKSFGLAYLLRDHLNTHTGERPHRCQECNKSFPWLSSLLVHQKIHMRKHQASNQPDSSPVASQGVGRAMGAGSRARRGSRSGWPRWGNRPGSGLPPLAVSFPGQGQEWQQNLQQPQIFIHQPNFQVQIRPRALQEHQNPQTLTVQQLWKMDRLLQPVMQTPPWQSENAQAEGQLKAIQSIHAPSDTSSGPEQNPAREDGLPVPGSEPSPGGQSTTSPSMLATAQQQNPTTGDSCEPTLVQNCPSKEKAPGPAPEQLAGQKKDELKVWNFKAPAGSGKPGAPPISITLSQVAVSEATRLTSGQEGAVWAFKSPALLPQALSLPESPGRGVEQKQQQQQQPHITSSWVRAPTSAQVGPITIQYGAAPFPHGDRPTLWGFRTAPVISQTLLAGPIQQGNGQTQQPLPIPAGPRILINQTPPFLSSPLSSLTPLALPAAHPLHSVAVSQLPRPPPQNIFFNPQSIVGDRPHMPQTVPLPQIGPRAELALGSRLNFPPDRLFQCMICGRSLPQELDLQMHYMQHAKGEI
ncbi:zinc finger protein 629 [Denticeps clupeoides]|uniref:zinc finger protein 629 n=1 Tax=Denticeps clupeoides TaxID=299321 RepID=UPI0010A3D549|nr:zinc finger protein 629-like [Denticeps clupeoides]